MTTLHMEVEIANSTQMNISKTHQELMAMLQTMNSQVHGLEPAWLGNSATEFFQIYETWHGQMNGLIEQLNTLSTRLHNEITQWEAVASKLG